MDYFVITKNKNGSLTIRDSKGRHCTYLYYTKKDAIQKFRNDNGYKYKKIEYIYL